MKKKNLLLILILLLCPILVYAKPHYLYDVIKNEVGLTRKYDSDLHQDSLDPSLSTENIYYWYAANEEDATKILNKNNVIFGGFCWQMIRTTDTGGVKMIYNGIPNEGKCNNTGTAQQIGVSQYSSTHDSVADVGYMYNKEYKREQKSIASTSGAILSSISFSGGKWWYSYEVSWDGSSNTWTLVNPVQMTGTETDYSFLKGAYTFGSTYDSYTSNKVSYIAGINGNYRYYIKLADGNDLSYYNRTFTYGTSYTDNQNGTYTIDSPTTIDYYNYFDRYTELDKKYVCINAMNNTCEEVLYVINVAYTSFDCVKQNTYKFANGFTYSDGQYTLNDVNAYYYTNPDELNKLSKAHYTCWNDTGVCSNISFVYYHPNISNIYYMKLFGGKSIEDLLSEMIDADDVNTKDSEIKTKIETWYENNLLDYTEYIDDVIYCGGRRIPYTSSWSPNGSVNTNISIEFRMNLLYCDKETDRFTTTNPKAKLKYPIGLMTDHEMGLIINNIPKKTGVRYWLMNPYGFGTYYPYYEVISENGTNVAYGGDVASKYGIRPAIALKRSMKYVSGDGSKDNPYYVSDSEIYKVNVEIKNETKDLSIEVEDFTMVEPSDIVRFSVTPIKGYKIKSIQIIDSENHDVNFIETNNAHEYEFIMPASDVTIIPTYEKTTASVSTEDNNHTKEIKIQVNDVSAVVWDDSVVFTVIPEEGYEVESIIITDEDDNQIEYHKTNNANEYQFIMPDTDVVIKPLYRKIESPTNDSPTTDSPANPKTRANILFVVMMLVLIGLTFISYKIKGRD